MQNTLHSWKGSKNKYLAVDWDDVPSINLLVMCQRIGCSIKMRNKMLLLPAWCQWPQPLVKPQQDASRWGDKAQLNWTKYNITTRFQITMLIWIQPIALCSNFKEWESGLTGKESVSHSCLDLKFKNLFPTWKVDNTCQEMWTCKTWEDICTVCTVQFIKSNI